MPCGLDPFPTIMQTLTKWTALECKIIAGAAWLCVGWFKVSLDISDLLATSQPMYRDAPQDWGTPAFYWRTSLEIVVICGCFVLSALPNRWLVSRRAMFWPALFFALLPMGYFIATFSGSLSDIPGSAFAIFMLSPVLIFLPLSLSLSYWRHRKGEKVSYV
jgi:hypothetical protein